MAKKNELSFEDLENFIKRHYLKNRTIVSKDIAGILDDIENVTDIPVIRHAFPSGKDYGTWIIPPRWDVKEAWLKDRNGKILASYQEHPLFVCPYSKAVHQTLSKNELLPHVFSVPKHPDAYVYNWRYASDPRLQLKDWGISLPQNLVDPLDNGPFEILIDTEVEAGNMLIGELVLPGRSEKTLMFLANYCHPGQVNDSFSGLTMLMKVMHSLSQRSQRQFTYRFLVMPETIGSAVYIAQDPSRLKGVFGTIFAETVGYGEAWYIKATREGNTYVDLLALDCRRRFKDVKISPSFFSLYCNDDLIFNSVQVGIPSLSVQKFPFEEYHTSKDMPSRVNASDLQYAHDIILHMVDVLERDAVFQFTGPVPFWMNRFNLSFDNINEDPNEFRFKFDIVYQYLDGKRSLLEIANILDVPFEKVFSFVQNLKTDGLVSRVDNSFENLSESISNLRK